LKQTFELLTCDIWDTVLRRRCHPDDVKLATARTLLQEAGAVVLPEQQDTFRLVRDRQACEGILGARRRASGGDDEYTASEVLDLHLARVAPALLAEERLRLVERLLEAEIRFERGQVFVDPDILDRIAEIPHRRLGFISDFYHPASVVRGYLQAAGVTDRFTVAYVSCDHGLNKRSGRLYQKVHADLGLRPEQHAHLGDNEDVDVRRPRALGVNAIHYPGGAVAQERSRHQRRWEERQSGGTEWCSQDLPSVVGRGDSDFERLVRDLTVIAGGFVLFTAEEARSAGCRELFFFTREGELFLQIFRALQERGLIPDALRGAVLEVSRVATFGPSLRALTPAELMRLWNQYSIQSMAAFLTSLGEAVGPYERALRAHGIVPEQVITYPWQDARVCALLADPAFNGPLWSSLTQKRTRLEGYLHSRGFPAEGPVGIVDIGWRGTIQDNLCHLLPRAEIHGFYLGLQAFLNTQPANGRKRAFGPDLNDPGHGVSDEMSMMFISPMEMLCNSPHGSTVGYEATSEGYTAVRTVDPDENRIWHQFTHPIQEAVLARIPSFAEDVRRFSVSSQELQIVAAERLHTLLTDPPRLLADAYFGLTHNESFGVGGMAVRSRRLPVRKFARAVLSRSGRKELWEFLQSTSWPQGYLRIQRLGPLVAPFNQQARRWLLAKRPGGAPSSPDPQAERLRELERIAREYAPAALRDLEQRLRRRAPFTRTNNREVRGR
jgi:FMN phosphatase YigB (HAD superfamily)